MSKNEKRTIRLVGLILALIFSTNVLTVLLMDSMRDISAQEKMLADNAQRVSKDFDAVRQMPNTEITITEGETTIVFKQPDCTLTAVYTNDMELVSLEQLDLRVGKHIESTIVIIVVMFALGFALGYSVAYLTMVIRNGIINSYEKRQQRRRNE